MKELPLYFDYNATTPIDRRVADAMKPYLYEHFGNPSSAHAYGRKTKEAIDIAREQVAGLLGCDADEIVFTSGGTESNNTVILGAARAWRGKKDHMIASSIEHPAVLELKEELGLWGCRMGLVGVDGEGVVDCERLEGMLEEGTMLISVMHANNEVGTIQPIARISEFAHRHGCWMHTDAAQSIGKIRVRVEELGVDFLSVAGHKFYGPKGVGALYVRRGVELPRWMHGARHESGRRAGTENILGIVGLGAASALCHEGLEEESSRLGALRDLLWSRLGGELGEKVRRHGGQEGVLPNTLNVGFVGLLGGELLGLIEGRVAASAGSACHSGEVSISSVLRAMEVPEASAKGALRFSVGRQTTAEEVEEAAEIVVGAARQLWGR